MPNASGGVERSVARKDPKTERRYVLKREAVREGVEKVQRRCHL